MRTWHFRFLASLLIEWPLCLLVSGAFTLMSAVIIPLMWFLRMDRWERNTRFGDRRSIRNWHPEFAYPWGNDEDGIDGLPRRDGVVFKNQQWREHTMLWSDFRRVFTWCVLRNSASNMRFMPIVGYKINPSRLRLGWHDLHVTGTMVTGESWYVWEGWRSNFYFEVHGVHFWIGWPQKPGDMPGFAPEMHDGEWPPTALPAEDTRSPGVTFKLQIRRNK